MKQVIFIFCILSSSIGYGMHADISKHPWQWNRDDIIEQSIECILKGKCQSANESVSIPKELVILLDNIISIKTRIIQKVGDVNVDQIITNPGLLEDVIKLELQCNTLQEQENNKTLKQQDIELLVNSIKKEYEHIYSLYKDSHRMQGDAMLLSLAMFEYDILREQFITKFDIQTRKDTKFPLSAYPLIGLLRERFLLWRSELVDLIDGYRITGNRYEKQVSAIGDRLIDLYQLLESIERRVFGPPFGGIQYYQHKKKKLLSELQKEYSDILGKNHE